MFEQHDKKLHKKISGAAERFSRTMLHNNFKGIQANLNSPQIYILMSAVIISVSQM